MKLIKLIICLFASLHFTFILNSQKNELKYISQFYEFELDGMNGVRQTLIYSHGLSKRLSLEGQIFTGSGRGMNISSDFGKDYVLLSKGNEGNVPPFLISLNEYYEGIHNYKRISKGLKQDNGWGISLNYIFLNKSKFKFDISCGYLVYNTKAIIKENIIDLEITFPTDSSVKDYQIKYPAAIHMNFDDGAIFGRLYATYKIKNRLSCGLNANVNYSMWGSGTDIGIGIGLTYVLNNIINE